MIDIFKSDICKGYIKNIKYLEQFISEEDKYVLLDMSCKEQKSSMIKSIILYANMQFDDIYKIFCVHCREDNLLAAKLIYDNACPKITLTMHLFKDMYNNGHEKIAKWIYESHNDIDIRYEASNFLFHACEHGFVGLVKWIIKVAHIEKDIMNDAIYIAFVKNNLEIVKILYDGSLFDFDIEGKFKILCTEGSFTIIKWLYSLKKDIKITPHMFYLACKSGNIDLVKWLYQLNENMLIDFDYCFNCSCAHERMLIAKWIYELSSKNNHKIDIHHDNDKIMYELCIRDMGGNNDLILWLHSLDEEGYKKNIQNGYLFSSVCINGFRVERVKWLYSLNDKINIHVNLDEAFISCCMKDKSITAEWLYSLDKVAYDKILKQNNNELLDCLKSRSDSGYSSIEFK